MPTLRYTLAAILISLAAIGLYSQSRQLEQIRAQLAEYQPSQIDIGFSQSMAIHHQQAIAMSQLILDGRPSGLRPLARNIAGQQLLELGQIQGWLRLWDKPFVPASKEMVWMLMGSKPLDEAFQQYVIDCGKSAEGMPGLASAEDMQQLRMSAGSDRDTLYLRLMLAHHQGGVPMARFATEEAHLPAVKLLAAQIVLDQSKEIQHISAILNAYAQAKAAAKVM
ncbi:DUF305 domain-containing protein [Zhongshania sp.]|jgi:uncharacterized protein (DUF305 family)|uniref:DUF305 domain-containing protein n=1 Tax=Zhongshania sp. TaxID=1971902 RepID=UPI0039E640E7